MKVSPQNLWNERLLKFSKYTRTIKIFPGLALTTLILTVRALQFRNAKAVCWRAKVKDCRSKPPRPAIKKQTKRKQIWNLQTSCQTVKCYERLLLVRSKLHSEITTTERGFCFCSNWNSLSYFLRCCSEHAHTHKPQIIPHSYWKKKNHSDWASLSARRPRKSVFGTLHH